jgi:plasmid maintenance system antidote protein VapI
MKKPKPHPLDAWIKAQGRGSISRLSEQTGLSTGHIHNIMKGAGMTTSTAKTLAKATGISAAVLMGLENA